MSGAAMDIFSSAQPSAGVSGIEANVHAQRRAAAKGLNVQHGSAEDLAGELAGTFDVVYVPDAGAHLRSRFFEALRLLLKPGGRLIVAVPNNEPYRTLQQICDVQHAAPSCRPMGTGILEAAGRHLVRTDRER